MQNMTKTISSRIDNRVHNELVERCNRIGCNINEFVAESVKFMLTNESDFEFGMDDEGDNSTTQVSIKEPEVISEVQDVRVVE